MSRLALLESPEALRHDWASQGTVPRVGSGEPAHSAEDNVETQQKEDVFG